MKNIYSELLRRLKQGIPQVIYTKLLKEGYSKKWIGTMDEIEDADLKEYFYPEERLIIFGGGHVSKGVSEIASICGFAVTVVDDRPEYTSLERFPEADQRVCCDFSESIEKLAITPYDYLVVVTRGHEYDKECLCRILSGERPRYIGMMGSKVRTESMRQYLMDQGFDSKDIERIHMPIGMKIGARTPEEIAVSIMAEVIDVKRHNGPDQTYATDTDYRILKVLAEEKEVCVIATILEVTGSSPRQSGAKMIVYSADRIVGTIGGGYAEGQIISKALSFIGTKKQTVIEINMTKDSENKDQMVCGGRMRVLLEGWNA